MPTNLTPKFVVTIASVIFLAVLLLIFIWMSNVKVLASLGLGDKLYYLVLVIIGLIPALLLFGVIRSHAKYKGKVFGGVLELGGPAVIFMLVLVVGINFVPEKSSFGMTVSVQLGSGGATLDAGRLRLHMNDDVRDLPVQRGVVHVTGIPMIMNGRTVEVELLDANGYELEHSTIELMPGGVMIRVKVMPSIFRGYVKDSKGEPIANAEISYRTHYAKTNARGYFELFVNDILPTSRASLQISANGFKASVYTVLPSNDELTAILNAN